MFYEVCLFFPCSMTTFKLREKQIGKALMCWMEEHCWQVREYIVKVGSWAMRGGF
jgi:hypothetical protein